MLAGLGSKKNLHIFLDMAPKLYDFPETDHQAPQWRVLETEPSLLGSFTASKAQLPEQGDQGGERSCETRRRFHP